MRLYRKDGHSFSFDNTSPIDYGSFGKIYRLPSDICYKIFSSSLAIYGTNSQFDEEIFNILKSLNLKNFYELYEIFYNKALTRILGYSSKYYESEDIDILTLPTDYLLNNLYNIYDDIKKISKENIIVSDLHDGNVILNSNKMIIIDTDLYHKSFFNRDNEDIFKSNLYSLCSLFTCICYEALDMYHENEDIPNKERLNSLFRPSKDNSIDNVCKKLIRYKYPIDYLSKKV